MPKVVVYVPTSAWRSLEERGFNPAAVVREFAKKGYEVSERVLPEREEGLEETQERDLAVQAPATKPLSNTDDGAERSPTSRSESTPKKRMYPCSHHLPPSKHCPYGCDG